MIATILIIAAIALDILSLVLSLVRNIKGHGASGVPIISWLVYLMAIERGDQTFFFTSKTQASVSLTVFHLLCHFGIPYAHLFVLRVIAKK